MKTLIYILGGQAVGKMTVGVELQKNTNLKQLIFDKSSIGVH